MEAWMHTFDDYRKTFYDFYKSVKAAGAGHAPKSHGLDHDATVAMLAVTIAPDSRVGEMAWVVAFLHSMDRWFGRWSTPEEREEINQKWQREMHVHLRELPEGHFSPSEVQRMFQAALQHGRIPLPEDDVVLRVLCAADMITNLQALVIWRSGAVFAHLPPIDLQRLGHRHPDAGEYGKLVVGLDDLYDNLGYLEHIRGLGLPKAIELAEEYAARIETFLRWVTADHQNIGLAGVKL